MSANGRWGWGGGIFEGKTGEEENGRQSDWHKVLNREKETEREIERERPKRVQGQKRTETEGESRREAQWKGEGARGSLQSICRTDQWGCSACGSDKGPVI